MADPAVPARSRIRVLVVDDSVVVRRALTALFESDPEIQVVGQASNGIEALELAARLRPDLVTMDLMMPKMDGMEATQRIMARFPSPVLFLSSHFGQNGPYSHADAVAAGALDVVEKPTLTSDWQWQASGALLIQKIKALSKIPVIAHIHAARRFAPPPEVKPGAPLAASDIVAIGASAGGPKVLEQMLSALPVGFGMGVVVVQHMGDGFTLSLLKRLQQRCALPVEVATDGATITPGRILFTPESVHLVVSPGGRVRLSDDEPVGGHRPSVDVTFLSAAEAYGPRAVGVLLTGMGTDGAQGLLAIQRAGGVTYAQDEQSCAVFGMPREAIELGAARHVLPPPAIVRSLVALGVERGKLQPGA
ncbi:MAG: chemotaxis-specific protein-glutamate methyltransferase CheB [Acidimicrobiia bacterium]|nr:chemotaxis-specific protein-glutamate methyltransferase CheB [Acidimicrobiia bacterium]